MTPTNFRFQYDAYGRAELVFNFGELKVLISELFLRGEEHLLPAIEAAVTAVLTPEAVAAERLVVIREMTEAASGRGSVFGDDPEAEVTYHAIRAVAAPAVSKIRDAARLHF